MRKGSIRGLVSALMDKFISNRVAENKIPRGTVLSKDGRVYDRQTTPAERKEAKEKIYVANGLKKFEYGDNYVYALNKKNADRKARLQGLI